MQNVSVNPKILILGGALKLAVVLALMFPFSADAANNCASLPDHQSLTRALKAAQAQANGGFNHQVWGTIVDRDGIVCAIAYTGETRDAQWPGSRLVSAQKANTANAFSLEKMALSTANLYKATQPGGALYGSQNSLPVNTEAASGGPADQYGSASDPLIGKVIGGTSALGGGLALYNASGAIIGGLGVGGDSSCADHNIAWRTRHALDLDYIVSGVASPNNNDQIIYDLQADGKSTSGYGHPVCAGDEVAVMNKLPATRYNPRTVVPPAAAAE